VVLALPALADILFWVGALIFCYLCVYIAKALFGIAGSTLGKLPIVGGWIDSSLHGVEQRITSVMSGAALAVDKRIATGFHNLARIVDFVGRELAAHSNLLYTLSSLAFGADITAALRYALTHLQGLTHGISSALTHTLHRLTTLEKRVTHLLDAAVLPRLRHLEREVVHTIDPELAALRRRTRTLENDYARLYKWIHTHPWTAVTGAFVGAVALALSRLGLDWIRCGTANRFFQKRGCNAWNDLDSLLGLVVAAVAVEDFRELVKLLQAVEAEAVKGIEVVLRA